MNIFITGINGFIGSALAATLREHEYHVVGSVSGTEKMACKSCQPSQCFVIRINEDFEVSVFDGVDVLIHCAYDLKKGRGGANLEGTQKLARAAIERGVKWQIYLGSYSAHEKAVSEYGRTKLELERFFGELGQIVVKPGLVIGNGGIFLKMVSLVEKFPVVPLIDGGKGRMPIVGIDDLVSSIVHLIEHPTPGVFRLYNSDQASLKQIFAEVKKERKLRTLFVPVPSSLIYLALVIAAKLRLPLQVDTGNLRGFQANQYASNETDLVGFVPEPMSLAEMVAKSRYVLLGVGIFFTVNRFQALSVYQTGEMLRTQFHGNKRNS